MVCVHAIIYQDETGKRRGLRTPQSYIQEKWEASVDDDEVHREELFLVSVQM